MFNRKPKHSIELYSSVKLILDTVPEWVDFASSTPSNAYRNRSAVYLIDRHIIEAWTVQAIVLYQAAISLEGVTKFDSDMKRYIKTLSLGFEELAERREWMKKANEDAKTLVSYFGGVENFPFQYPKRNLFSKLEEPYIELESLFSLKIKVAHSVKQIDEFNSRLATRLERFSFDTELFDWVPVRPERITVAQKRDLPSDD